MTEDAIACSSQPSAWVALPMPMREASSTPTNAAQTAESDVGEIDRAADVDAGKARGFRVGADGEEIAAPAAVMEEDIGRNATSDHHPEQVRDAEEVAAREPGEGVVGDRDRRAVGHQKADAAQRRQRRQRDDERRQAHLDDAEGVEDADGKPIQRAPSATAIQIGKPAWSAAMATITVVKPTTAPTERSMPPVMMTKVSPMREDRDHRALTQTDWRCCSAVQKVWSSNDRSSQQQQQQAKQGQAEQDVDRAAPAAAASARSSVAHACSVSLALRRRSPRSGCPRATSSLVARARDEPAAAEHVQRVGQFVDLGQIGRDQDDAGALLQQRAEQPVDFGLGADVDADGRLVEDEQLGAVVEPFADDDLLLVAARQAGRPARARDGALMREVADLLVARAPLPRGPMISGRCGQPRVDRQVDVEADRQVEASGPGRAGFPAPARCRARMRVPLAADRDRLALARGSPGGLRAAAEHAHGRTRCGRRRSGRRGRRSRPRARVSETSSKPLPVRLAVSSSVGPMGDRLLVVDLLDACG